MHMSRRRNNRGRRPQELGLSGFVEIANVLFLEQTAQHLMSQTRGRTYKFARLFCAIS